MVTVKDGAAPADEVPSHTVTFVTSDGELYCPPVEEEGDVEAQPRSPSIGIANACTTKTNPRGVAKAKVTRATPGTVTVTILAGKAGTDDVDVTFFGNATEVSASSEQTSVERGGELRVTLTVTDADGRAVVGAKGRVTAPIVNHIEGPSDGAQGVKVFGLTDETKETVDSGKDPSDPPYCSGNSENANAGTNDKGQCVVVVEALADPPATGGAWTINFALASTDAEGKPTTLSESITLTVAGPPSGDIDHDAPERADRRARVTVTLTVTDADGNLVGTQDIEITAVEGDVALLNKDEKTKNGKASFTFFVQTNATGTGVFLARAGEASTLIEVALGPKPVVEPEPEPAPDPGPPLTWNNELVSGQNLVVWNGEDGADPSAGAAEGVTAIWSYNTGSGSWDGYFPGAADVPGGNTLTSLSNGQAYVVIVE